MQTGGNIEFRDSHEIDRVERAAKDGIRLRGAQTPASDWLRPAVPDGRKRHYSVAIVHRKIIRHRGVATGLTGRTALRI
jgi:hypothetical protein